MTVFLDEQFPPPQAPPPLAVSLGAGYQHIPSPVDGTGVARLDIPTGGFVASPDRTLYNDVGPVDTIDLTVSLRFDAAFPWTGADECCMIQIQRETNANGVRRPGVSIRFNMPSNGPRYNTIEINGGMLGGVWDHIVPTLTPADIFSDGGFHSLRIRETDDGTTHWYQAWIDGMEVTGPHNNVGSDAAQWGRMLGFRCGHRLINVSGSGHWVEYDSIVATDGA